MPPQTPDDLVLEPLSKSHDRKSFSCGDSDLDNYIKQYARKNTEYGFGRAYVAVIPGQKRVWAFYTLSASHVDASRLPSSKGCPQFVSVALMGRLGVDTQIQRIGVGQLLMGHAFEMALEAAQRIGIHAFFIQAKDEQAKGYYLRYGFHPFLDNPLHVYLPLSTISQV